MDIFDDILNICDNTEWVSDYKIGRIKELIKQNKGSKRSE